MKSRRTPLTAWTRIGAGAMALAAALVGVGTAANAVPASSTPDVSRDGDASITIHKKVGEGLSYGANNGLELPADEEPPNPLQGAKFKLSRVVTSPELDLTTNDSWKTVSTINTEAGVNPSRESLLAAGAVKDLEEISTDTTGEDGTIRFSGLAFGLYYVEETDAPAGFSPVSPFLVTLPMSHPIETDHWLYDVHVYPKDRYAPEKMVIDSDNPTGQEGAQWVITSSIPAGPVLAYRVEDTLDSRLVFKPGVSVTLNEGTGASAKERLKLVEGTDFEVNLLPDTDDNGIETQRLVVNFLESGLDKLSDEANKKLRPTVTFTTAVTGLGHINNRAQVYENNINRSADEALFTTNEVASRWGMLKLTKTDSKDANKLLAGAEFDLYYSHTNDFKTAQKTSYSSITNEDGVAEIGPLRYSDFADNIDTNKDSNKYWYYWLVETQAPEGYKKLSQPIPVEVRKDNTDDSDRLNLTVRNVLDELPLTPGPGGEKPGSILPGLPGGLATTGAAGIIALLIATGIAVFVGAGLKRKGKENADA